MKIIERRLQEIGKSLLVTLPKQWTTTLHLQKGSKVKLVISEQGSLSIVPEFVEKREKKAATITFDENYKRRFIREFFNGNETITLRLSKALSEQKRKGLYSFLHSFMSAEIIEETGHKLVVRTYRIEELSIDDCLRRIYGLSIRSLEGVQERQSQAKRQEIAETTRRFYYMLVMQIRRFLSEGKYTEQKISLIRAMDMRMAAERVSRIMQSIISLGQVKDKELQGFLEEVIHFYREAFNVFRTNNYEKALCLQNKAGEIRKKYNKKKYEKDILMYKQQQALMAILKNARDISMFVR